MATNTRKRDIPEAQRKTERIVLRLDPEVAGRLRGIAYVWGESLANVVTAAIEALEAKGAKR